MTHELHRTQPFLTTFEAKVVDRRVIDGGLAIVELDATAFYARSGGQAGDAGAICTTRRERMVVKDTRYGADGRTVEHLIDASGADWLPVGSTVFGDIDKARRHNLTVGHTAQHLAYLAAVMVLGPRPAVGGSIEPDGARVEVAHTADEGDLRAGEIAEAYRSLTDLGAEIGRWPDPSDPPRWWWAIDGHEAIPCGGTHATSTDQAAPLSISAKRKGSKAAVMRLAWPKD